MTTTITCDYCGQTIARDDKIVLSIEDYGWLGRSLAAIKVKERIVAPEPEKLASTLDLHRDCYVVHYKATVEQRRIGG